jgi:cobalt/nickel transport system permease protein
MGRVHASGALDVDRLARGDSLVHRLDARAKVLGALAVILGIVRVVPPTAWKLAILAAAVLTVALLSRVPLRFLLTRSAVAIPVLAFFVLTAPLLPGPVAHNFANAGLIVAKALLSICVATTLMATTPWHKLLQALRGLWVPRAFVLILQFLHRYLFVLMEEVAAMRRARDARLVAAPGLASSLASGSGMIGTLFIRTLERAERVESAMLSRGFTGECRTLDEPRFTLRDAAALAASVAFAIAVTRA